MDNGNNNNILTLAKANFRPYGIDSPWGPTGRFSNGKLIIDLLGELLNHPYLPAYEDTTDPKSILRGVNYASAGSGILEETGILLGQSITFSQQVQNFQKTLSQLKDQMDDKNLSQYLANSLAIVSHGSNDYLINYLLNFKWVTYDAQTFADLLIQSYKRYIMDLHGFGIRKFLLAGVGPLGCIPKILSIRMIWPGLGQCVEYVNDMVGLFNAGLISLVKQLNNDNPGSIFVYGNTLDHTLWMLSGASYKMVIPMGSEWLIEVAVEFLEWEIAYHSLGHARTEMNMCFGIHIIPLKLSTEFLLLKHLMDLPLIASLLTSQQ